MISLGDACYLPLQSSLCISLALICMSPHCTINSGTETASTYCISVSGKMINKYLKSAE